MENLRSRKGRVTSTTGSPDEAQSDSDSSSSSSSDGSTHNQVTTNVNSDSNDASESESERSHDSSRPGSSHSVRRSPDLRRERSRSSSSSSNSEGSAEDANADVADEENRGNVGVQEIAQREESHSSGSSSPEVQIERSRSSSRNSHEENRGDVGREHNPQRLDRHHSGSGRPEVQTVRSRSDSRNSHEENRGDVGREHNPQRLDRHHSGSGRPEVQTVRSRSGSRNSHYEGSPEDNNANGEENYGDVGVGAEPSQLLGPYGWRPSSAPSAVAGTYGVNIGAFNRSVFMFGANAGPNVAIDSPYDKESNFHGVANAGFNAANASSAVMPHFPLNANSHYEGSAEDANDNVSNEENYNDVGVGAEPSHFPRRYGWRPISALSPTDGASGANIGALNSSAFMFGANAGPTGAIDSPYHMDYNFHGVNAGSAGIPQYPQRTNSHYEGSAEDANANVFGEENYSNFGVGAEHSHFPWSYGFRHFGAPSAIPSGANIGALNRSVFMFGANAGPNVAIDSPYDMDSNFHGVANAGFNAANASSAVMPHFPLNAKERRKRKRGFQGYRRCSCDPTSNPKRARYCPNCK